jgi:hypothetical protein
VAPWVVALWVAATWGALGALASSARADGTDYHEEVEPPRVPHWLTVPIEIGDAVTLAGEKRGALYRWSGGVQPGMAFERFSFHAPVELHYRNPGVDVAVGVRATWAFWHAVGGFVPVRLVAQASYFLREPGIALNVGPMVGLGTLVHLTPLYGFDFDRKVHSLGIRIGFNAVGFVDPVAAIAHFVPQAPPPVFEAQQ